MAASSLHTPTKPVAVGESFEDTLGPIRDETDTRRTPAKATPAKPVTIIDDFDSPEDTNRAAVYSEALLKRVLFETHPHDYEKLPLKPCVHFFELLAPPPRGSRQEEKRTSGRLRVNIPDTIVFSDARDSMTWLYTSTDGYVFRADDGTDRHVIARLGREPEEQQDLLVAVLKKPSSMNKYTANDVSLLSSKTLVTALSAQPNRPFYIQKFVAFKGKRATIVRCVYEAGRAPRAFVITSQNTVDDTSITDLKRRFCVITAEPKACSVFKLTGRALGEVGDQTTAIVRYVEQNVTPRPCFSQLVADFIRDAAGTWWLLQVKHFTLSEKSLRHFEALSKASTLALSLKAQVQAPQDRSAAAGSARDSYLMTLTCHCCRTRCAQDELVYELTLKMILETVAHLKARGVTLRWFAALESSTVIAEDKAKFYAPQKVCGACYDTYTVEQKLRRMVTRFAVAIGVPVSAETLAAESAVTPALGRSAGASSALGSSTGGGGGGGGGGASTPSRATMPEDWHYSFRYGEAARVTADEDSMRPAELRQYRCIIFLHELYETPDLVELFGEGTFYLQFTLFGYTTRVPLTLVPGSVLPVHKLRVFHFWADEAGLIEYLERQQKVEVAMYASSRPRPLSSTMLYLKQFQSGIVSKLDFFNLFSTREMAECGLKATLGFVKLRDVASPQQFSMQRHQGIFIPTDPGFYSVDPLPEEWMVIIPNKHSFLESLPEEARTSRKAWDASKRGARRGLTSGAAFAVTEVDRSDEGALTKRLESLAGRFAARTYADTAVERNWLLRVDLDAVTHLEAIEGEHWTLNYKVLGEKFSSHVVRYGARGSALPLNCVDNIHLQCSYDGIGAWLAMYPKAEFDVVSRERSAGGMASVKLAPLLTFGMIRGSFPLGAIVGDVSSRRDPVALTLSMYLIDLEDAPDAAELSGPVRREAAAVPSGRSIAASAGARTGSGASSTATASSASPSTVKLGTVVEGRERADSSSSSDHALHPELYD